MALSGPPDADNHPIRTDESFDLRRPEADLGHVGPDERAALVVPPRLGHQHGRVLRGRRLRVGFDAAGFLAGAASLIDSYFNRIPASSPDDPASLVGRTGLEPVTEGL